MIFSLVQGVIDFGTVHHGQLSKIQLSLTNVSVEIGRFKVRQPKSAALRVVYTPGPVSGPKCFMLRSRPCSFFLWRHAPKSDMTQTYLTHNIDVLLLPAGHGWHDVQDDRRIDSAERV